MDKVDFKKVQRGPTSYSYAPGQRIRVGIPVAVELDPAERRTARWQDKVKIRWREAIVTQVYPNFRFRYANEGTEHKVRSGMYLTTEV